MFGENLRRLREERGLNQTELAEILGTTKQSVNRYEKNLREPNIKTASEFAKRLGVPLHVLTGEQAAPSPSSEDKELMEYLDVLKTRPECRMLFKLTKDASKADVEKAVAIVEALRRTEEQ